MVITTKSGSKYVFTVKDNKLYILNGTQEGIVSSMSGLMVGQRLEVYFRSLNSQTYKESEDVSFLQTTPIVCIE